MPSYAYLGPRGTFSEEALLSLGIEDLTSVPCPSIEEVFAVVGSGKVDAGIVPIENSVEGSVNATLDALAFDSDLTISSEHVLDIRHALIAAAGTTLSQVTEVVSHPHATAQCRKWLSHNVPNAAIVAANSTAEAVERAVSTEGMAAVGTRLAAESYGGEILSDSIEDFADNKTRFVVVDRTTASRTGDDKTSLALFLHHDKPGALLMILSEFAYGEINLTKIQSRPTKRVLGEYMFFADLEGHMDDPAVTTALNCLRLKLRTVKVLGSYPHAARG
jgi:prephenate dehydratase